MGAPVIPRAETVTRRSRRENFTVASRLLPGPVRRDLLAIYGFARLVDDIGDEAPGERTGLLDWAEGELDRVYAGNPTHPLMVGLMATVRNHGLAREPFHRLIAANRQDQVVTGYPDFAALLRYCELSANPVGHLVLQVLHAETPERLRLSDSICTGLQLVEHWQDVAEDAARGRVYLPEEDLARFGVSREDLEAPRVGPAFRRLMAFEVRRARGLLDRGAPLARLLGGRVGLAVAGFVAGGLAALDAIARADYDVLSNRPRPSRVRRLLALPSALAAAGRGR